MTTFLVPARGLSVELPVSVGPVELLPVEQARVLLREKASDPTTPEMFVEPLTQFAEGLVDAVARVGARDQKSAIVLVENALAVLRVWIDSTSHFETTSFGLRDGNWFGVVDLVNLESGGMGWSRYGHAVGYTVNAEGIEGFAGSLFASIAGDAIGVLEPEEGPRRALLGCRLVSQAILARDPAVSIVLAMTAAEALLVEARVPGRPVGPRKWTLAQRAIFLLCGAHDADMCGRHRDTCPILAASPRNKKNELGDLRDRGNTDFRWRCSEWHHFLDRYDVCPWP